MRDKFKEFYKASDEEIKDFWDNAFFSFDANILLNLYRYSEQTRDEILETLDYLSVKGRLWISHQAAFEYQKNRLIVIDGQKNAYENLKEALNKRKNEIETELNLYKKHPFLNATQIKDEVNELFTNIDNRLNELNGSHPDFFDDDPVFEKLTEIFDECVGERFTDDELANIYKEGKVRYEKKIPPGFMDKKEKENNGEQSLYGDLIIWKELLKRFSGNEDKIIFVTDDLKEDWWYIFKGKTLSPRHELLREFINITTKEILIYKPEQFLQFAKSNLEQEVNDETLEEVEQIRKYDESYIDLSKFLNLTGSTVGITGANEMKFGLNEAGQIVSSNSYGIDDIGKFLRPNNLIYGNINPQFIVSTPSFYESLNNQYLTSFPTSAIIATEQLNTTAPVKTLITEDKNSPVDTSAIEDNIGTNDKKGEKK